MAGMYRLFPCSLFSCNRSFASVGGSRFSGRLVHAGTLGGLHVLVGFGARAHARRNRGTPCIVWAAISATNGALWLVLAVQGKKTLTSRLFRWNGQQFWASVSVFRGLWILLSAFGLPWGGYRVCYAKFARLLTVFDRPQFTVFSSQFLDGNLHCLHDGYGSL